MIDIFIQKINLFLYIIFMHCLFVDFKTRLGKNKMQFIIAMKIFKRYQLSTKISFLKIFRFIQKFLSFASFSSSLWVCWQPMSHFWHTKFHWQLWLQLCYAKHTIQINKTGRPCVNFINIKRANFLYKTSFRQLFSSYMYVKKRHLYEQFVRFTLMKLTACYLQNLNLFVIFCCPKINQSTNTW